MSRTISGAEDRSAARLMATSKTARKGRRVRFTSILLRVAASGCPESDRAAGAGRASGKEYRRSGPGH